MSNTITLGDVTSLIYSKIRETNSNVAPSTNIKQYINDAYLQVISEKYYEFLDETLNMEVNKDTSLAEDIDSTNTDFDVSDGSVLESSGTLTIEDDVIEYTGVSTNNVTGVTGIGSDHSSGTNVQTIYDIENDLGVTDFDKPIFLSLDGSEVEYYDGRGALDENKYKIANGYLYLPFNSDTRSMVFKYKKQPTARTSDSDTFLIPDKYITVLVDYAVYIYKLDARRDDYDRDFMEYKRKKKWMKADFGRQTEGKYQRIRSIYQPNFKRN